MLEVTNEMAIVRRMVDGLYSVPNLNSKHKRLVNIKIIKSFNICHSRPIFCGWRYTINMLLLSNALLNKSVLSLRTGTPIAQIIGPIINPDNLKVEGFYCNDRFEKKHLVLLYQDIREVLAKGYVVNDHDALTDPGELVRLKKVMDIDFELIGKQVVTTSKQKIGKVSDYATETETMYIQKIYVSQSIIKSLTGGGLSVDRNQVTEITPRRIIINDLEGTSAATAPATA